MQDQGFVRTIAKMERDFTVHLKQLIDALQALSTSESNNHMANLALRLDFNNYYKEFFDRNPITIDVSSSFMKTPPSSVVKQEVTKEQISSKEEVTSAKKW